MIRMLALALMWFQAAGLVGPNPPTQSIGDSSTAYANDAFIQQNVQVLSSGYTNATTSFTNVMGFAIGANAVISGHCVLYYNASAATAGPKVQFTGPSTPTLVFYSAMFNTNVTGTFVFPNGTNYGAPLTAGTTVTASTNIPVLVFFNVINGTTAGTLELQAAAQGTGTLSISSGSSCHL